MAIQPPQTITGGDGDDVIGYDMDDLSVTGGAGTDTLSAALLSTAVTIDLSDSEDVFSGFENIEGGSANDTLTGDNNDNMLSGGSGNDSLTGGDGNDSLDGGDGDDILTGGDGQ